MNDNFTIIQEPETGKFNIVDCDGVKLFPFKPVDEIGKIDEYGFYLCRRGEDYILGRIGGDKVYSEYKNRHWVLNGHLENMGYWIDEIRGDFDYALTLFVHNAEGRKGRFEIYTAYDEDSGINDTDKWVDLDKVFELYQFFPELFIQYLFRTIFKKKNNENN